MPGADLFVFIAFATPVGIAYKAAFDDVKQTYSFMSVNVEPTGYNKCVQECVERFGTGSSDSYQKSFGK